MSRLRWLTAQFPMAVLARRNLSRASARSILAVTAVVIGVVAIGSIGVGGDAFKRDQLEAYQGFDGTATVHPVGQFPDPEPGAFSFSEDELSRLRQAAGPATVLPVIDPGGTLVRTPSGRSIVTAEVRGIETPATFYAAESGEIPENWRRTVVVGSRLAANNDIEAGDRITVAVLGEFDRSFRVAAILEPQGFADPLSADRAVFVPLEQFDREEYDEAIVRVDPTVSDVDTVAAAIEGAFNVRERQVRIEKVREQREQFREAFGTINRFLVGVGAISLLVAAVTIANTMLMSVIEREGEIGVFRAVGYPKTAVVRLLVAEATILGGIGAVVGAPVALGIGAVANHLFLGDPLAFTATGLQQVAFGVGVGVITALVAGLYPAWKAANKRPVEAIDS